MKKITQLLLIISLLFVISACEKPDVYSVSFVDPDGNVFYVITSEDNKVLPEDPTKEGHSFEGWFFDEEYTTPYTEVHLANILQEDITVYAKWSLNEYTITLHFNQGFETIELDYMYGEFINLYEEAYEYGYNTLGVYLDEEKTDTVGNAMMVTDDQDLYVVLEPITVLVEYHTSIPVDISAFSLGSATNHIATTNGKVFGWGANFNGTLGTTDFGTEIRIPGPEDITEYFELTDGEYITQLEEDYFVLALTSEHRVFGWGTTENYELGAYQEDPVRIPTDITMGLPLDDGDYVVSISVGYRHSILLTNTGRLIASGNNEYGQLGNGLETGFEVFTEYTDLVPLNDGEIIIDAQAYLNSTILLTSDNRILTTGSNNLGQLGIGVSGDTNEFTDITDSINLTEGETFEKIECGKLHVLVLTSTGNVYGFGANNNGELGLGETLHFHSPELIFTGAGDIYATRYTSYIFNQENVLFGSGSVFTDIRVFNTFDERSLKQFEVLTDKFNEGIFTNFYAGENCVWIQTEHGSHYGYGVASNLRFFGEESGVKLEDFLEIQYELVHSQPVSFGEVFDLYQPVPREFVEFDGWYMSSFAEYPWNEGRALDRTSLSLYGTWNLPTYEVTVHTNNEQDPYTVSYAVDDSILFDVLYEGHRFDGWFSDEALTTPLDLDRMPEYDFHIYAKWVEQVIVEVAPDNNVYEGSLSHNVFDIYTFTLTEEAEMTIFASSPDYLYPTLLDEDMNVYTVDSVSYHTTGYTCTEKLPAGTYYYEIKAGRGLETDYTVTFVFPIEE